MICKSCGGMGHVIQLPDGSHQQASAFTLREMLGAPNDSLVPCEAGCVAGVIPNWDDVDHGGSFDGAGL